MVPALHRHLFHKDRGETHSRVPTEQTGFSLFASGNFKKKQKKLEDKDVIAVLVFFFAFCPLQHVRLSQSGERADSNQMLLRYYFGILTPLKAPLPRLQLNHHSGMCVKSNNRL